VEATAGKKKEDEEEVKAAGCDVKEARVPQDEIGDAGNDA
jgi:hypothetical protein